MVLDDVSDITLSYTSCLYVTPASNLPRAFHCLKLIWSS